MSKEFMKKVIRDHDLIVDLIDKIDRISPQLSDIYCEDFDSIKFRCYKIQNDIQKEIGWRYIRIFKEENDRMDKC